jgi:hypothetical protein
MSFNVNYMSQNSFGLADDCWRKNKIDVRAYSSSFAQGDIYVHGFGHSDKISKYLFPSPRCAEVQPIGIWISDVHLAEHRQTYVFG